MSDGSAVLGSNTAGTGADTTIPNTLRGLDVETNGSRKDPELDSVPAEEMENNDAFAEEPVEEGSGGEGDLSTLAERRDSIEPIVSDRDSVIVDEMSRSHQYESFKICNWRVLWGIFMANCSQRLTKQQYQSMRTIADAFQRLRGCIFESWKDSVANCENSGTERGSISCLPRYSMLCGKFRSILFSDLTVKHEDSLERVDTTKAGARPASFGEDGTPQVPARIVLPSEYARFDVSTVSVLIS